jgi:transcriptional/translational regulatory protein YebC/TACO1
MLLLCPSLPNVYAFAEGDSADPALNSALATAVAKAKDAGVPKANIQAALEQVCNLK